jgi:hypothetical protein
LPFAVVVAIPFPEGSWRIFYKYTRLPKRSLPFWTLEENEDNMKKGAARLTKASCAKLSPSLFLAGPDPVGKVKSGAAWQFDNRQKTKGFTSEEQGTIVRFWVLPTKRRLALAGKVSKVFTDVPRAYGRQTLSEVKRRSKFLGCSRSF